MNNKNHSESISRVFDLLPYIKQKFSRQVAFGFRRNGLWKTISTEEYISCSDQVSYALLEMGIGKGDNIASITPNRPEFNFVDMGMLQIGAVHVSLYPGLTESKLLKILIETGCKVVFLANKSVLAKIQSNRNRLPQLLKIISFEPIDGAFLIDDLLRLGEAQADPNLLARVKTAVQPSDPASIIYISGATTAVKGVVLTHQNHVSTFLSYAESSQLSGISAIVSLLPLAHSYERMINYSQQYFGISIWYNEKLPAMLKDFEETRPEMVVMVPLLIERLLAMLEQQSMKSWFFHKRLLRKAIEEAKHLEPGNRPALIQGIVLMLARWLIFRHWRKWLGGRMRFIQCGGAALNPQFLNLFHTMGIPVYEGYGITEAGPLVSNNVVNGFRKFTVGKPMPGIEVQIAQDNEVLVKSPGIMPGYYKNPEESVKVIDHEGWLHTGDLGKLDKDGFLILTGIKKEIFKLSSGLYVSPAAIEKRLKESSVIRQVWVYGHNRNFLSAIIIPNVDTTYKSIPGNEPDSEKTARPYPENLSYEIEHAIKIYNNSNRGPDQVLKFAVVYDEWSIENGLLTKNEELNRMKLFQFYSDLIKSLY